MQKSEAAVKFAEIVKADKELQENIRAAKSADEVITLAAEKGITLEKSDFAPNIEMEELDPEQLESVAGGKYGCDELSCILFLGEMHIGSKSHRVCIIIAVKAVELCFPFLFVSHCPNY